MFTFLAGQKDTSEDTSEKDMVKRTWWEGHSEYTAIEGPGTGPASETEYVNTLVLDSLRAIGRLSCPHSRWFTSWEISQDLKEPVSTHSASSPSARVTLKLRFVHFFLKIKLVTHLIPLAYWHHWLPSSLHHSTYFPPGVPVPPKEIVVHILWSGFWGTQSKAHCSNLVS